jgi:hypothetical protein
MAEVNLVRIKMLRSKTGSPDGANVKNYLKDEEYAVPEGLAKTFVEDDKVAERIEEKAEKAVKNKAAVPPKNKAEEAPESDA